MMELSPQDKQFAEYIARVLAERFDQLGASIPREVFDRLQVGQVVNTHIYTSRAADWARAWLRVEVDHIRLQFEINNQPGHTVVIPVQKTDTPPGGPQFITGPDGVPYGPFDRPADA